MTTLDSVNRFVTQQAAVGKNASLGSPHNQADLLVLLNDPVVAEAALRIRVPLRLASVLEVRLIELITTDFTDILARLPINWLSPLERNYLTSIVADVQPSYEEVIAALLPSIWFRMDEAVSPAVNRGSLGATFNGTVTNVTFEVATGLPVIPKAYGYNGSTSLLATGSNAALASLEWTAAALVNLSTAGEGSIGYFCEIQTSGSALVFHYRFNGNLTTLLSQVGDSAGGAKSTTTTPGITGSTWVWVFCSYHADTKQPYLYRSLNHVLTEYGYSFRAPLTGNALSAAKMTVGNNAANTGAQNGNIAQFMLFSRVLTTDEMQSIITASEV